MTQRLNISVPDKLAKEMEAYKGEIVWSKVCQKAFIAAMQEADRIKEEERQTRQTIKEMIAAKIPTSEVIQEMKHHGFDDKAIIEFLRKNG